MGIKTGQRNNESRRSMITPTTNPSPEITDFALNCEINIQLSTNEVFPLRLLNLMCYLTLLVNYEAVGVVFIDLFSEVCCKSRQDFNFLFAAKNCQIEFLFSIAF